MLKWNLTGNNILLNDILKSAKFVYQKKPMKCIFISILAFSATANAGQLVADVTENKIQRMQVAETLTIGKKSDRRLIANQTVKMRHTNPSVVRASARRINSAGLLDGYDKSMLSENKHFVTLDKILKFHTFDDEVLYLENERTYQITPDVVGWIGLLLNEQGEQVGTARFEMFESGIVAEHFHLPNKKKYEIVPVPGENIHDIVEHKLSSTMRTIDSPDTRTPEQLDRSRQEIEDRLSGPEFEERLRRQEEMICLEKEKQREEQNKLGGGL